MRGAKLENICKQLSEDKVKSFVKIIYDLSPTELITTGCIISIIICQFTTYNEQNTLGNFLEMVGQILLSSNAQAATVDPKSISPSLCQIEKLKNELLKIINSKNK